MGEGADVRGGAGVETGVREGEGPSDIPERKAFGAMVVSRPPTGELALKGGRFMAEGAPKAAAVTRRTGCRALAHPRERGVAGILPWLCVLSMRGAGGQTSGEKGG